MLIQTYINELEQLKKEIKNNNIRNSMLRKRIKELEMNITSYLTEKGQPGLKYGNNAIILENKEKRLAKNKKEKETDIISLLNELGVQDPVKAYTKIQEAQKGMKIDHTKIKFINNIKS